MTIKERIREGFSDLIKEEDGVGVVEIILILVVLIALIVIFKDQLTAIVESILGGIRSGVDSIVQ